VNTEERMEIDRHGVRLEQLEREFGVIAAREAANAQRISDTRAALERQGEQLGDRITVLDFKLTQKLDALSAEHTQHKALLEDVQREFRVLADTCTTNSQNIEKTRAALEHQIEQVDHRVMVLDVKVHEQLGGLQAKLEGLEMRMDSKLEGLEARMDSKLDGLGKELSRIVAHLGLNGAAHPAKRL